MKPIRRPPQVPKPASGTTPVASVHRRARIRHPFHGIGIVQEVRADTIRAAFDDGETHEFLRSVRIEVLAPQRTGSVRRAATVEASLSANAPRPAKARSSSAHEQSTVRATWRPVSDDLLSSLASRGLIVEAQSSGWVVRASLTHPYRLLFIERTAEGGLVAKPLSNSPFGRTRAFISAGPEVAGWISQALAKGAEANDPTPLLRALEKAKGRLIIAAKTFAPTPKRDRRKRRSQPTIHFVQGGAPGLGRRS